MLRRALAILAFAWLVAPSSAEASDDWRAAEELFFQQTETTNTTAYTTQLGEQIAATADPLCPRMGKTAWWKLTGTGQPITLSTAVSGTTFNTVLAVMAGTPDAGSRIACNDDRAGDPLNRSELMFNSTRGATYLIQVGGLDPCGTPSAPTPCPRSGNLALQASSVRPLNDDRATPAALVAGVPGTTSNLGASQERGEEVTCGNSRFAATVWYRWTAPGTGDAVFRANAAFANILNQSDTVLAVYRDDTGARIGCSDDAGARFGASAVTARVTAGDYLLQIGAHVEGAGAPVGEGRVEGKAEFAPDADGDGASTLTDCNDANAGIFPGALDVAGNGIDEDCNGADTPLDPVQAALAADKDGDRYPARVDCRDDDPAINPGAVDKPADAIDQDCRGGDAQWPELGVRVTGLWEVTSRFSRSIGLVISRSPARVTVRITCTGGGCPFKTRKREIRKATSRYNLHSLVKGAKLKRGAKLEIRVTRNGYVGVITTWQLRSPQAPKRTDTCLIPGRRRPVRC